MKPPAMTHSTKMPFAATRLVVQIACTWGVLVSSGVASTDLPSASITGLKPVLAIQPRKSLIALRTCPGISNPPGSSSEPLPDGSGDGTPPGRDGAGSGTRGAPGSGTPGDGVGAGAAHAGLVPTVPTAAPVAVAVASAR